MKKTLLLGLILIIFGGCDTPIDPPPDTGDPLPQATSNPKTEKEIKDYERKAMELRYMPGEVWVEFIGGPFGQYQGATIEEKRAAWAHDMSLKLEPILAQKMLAKGLTPQKVDGDIIEIEKPREFGNYIVRLKNNDRIEDLLEELKKDPYVLYAWPAGTYYPINNNPKDLFLNEFPESLKGQEDKYKELKKDFEKKPEIDVGDYYPGLVEVDLNFEQTPFSAVPHTGGGVSGEVARQVVIDKQDAEWRRDIDYLRQKAKELKPILIANEEAQGNILPESIKALDPFEIRERIDHYHLVYLYNENPELLVQELQKDANIKQAKKITHFIYYGADTKSSSNNDHPVSSSEEVPLSLASGDGSQASSNLLSLFSPGAKLFVFACFVSAIGIGGYFWRKKKR